MTQIKCVSYRSACLLPMCEFVCCLRWSLIRVQEHKEANEATRQTVQQRNCNAFFCYIENFFISNSFVPFRSVSSYQKRLPCECACKYVFYCIIIIIELVYFRFSLCALFSLLLLLFLLLLYLSISLYTHLRCIARLCSCNAINCMS